MSSTLARFAPLAAAVAIILYIALGLSVIPLLGPQQDETIFVRGILPPIHVESASHRNQNIPFMLMPYLGALKIWIYKAVFLLAPPDLWSLRIPVLLMGACSVLLTFLLARRFLPAVFAASASLMLAADPMFLLTGTFDWGPVALQHLLVLLMVWAAMRTHETGHWIWAAVTGMAMGLGIWDKISFLWLLGGLLAAARGRLWRGWKVSVTVLAAALLASAPLLRYNLRFDLASFRSTVGVDFSEIGMKINALWLTLDGSALFGFLVNDSGSSGWPGASLQGYVLLAALAAIPFLATLRPAAIFLATSFAVTFLLMAAMKNAGASAHHTVLLWPLPQLLIATAAAEFWSRGVRAKWFAPAAIAAVILSGLLVTARYMSLARQQGPASQWTTATARLAERLEQHRAPAIFVTDWGILDPLRLAAAGRLPLLVASDTVVILMDQLPESQSMDDWRLARLKDRSTLVVTHPNRLLNFPGANEKLDRWANAQGLRRVPVEEIADSWGVTQFELSRYQLKP